MSDNVVTLPGITSLKVSPDRVIEAAAHDQYGLTEVVIIGTTKDGEFYFASSETDSPSVIYYLERAKHKLMKIEDQLEVDGDPRGKPGRHT